MKELPKQLGGILAIAALGSGLLNGVDPVTCLLRGLGAYFVGVVSGQLWNLLVSDDSGPREPSSLPHKPKGEESPDEQPSS